MSHEEKNIIYAIIALFIPPLAVGLKTGIGFSLILNIILTLLGFLPGVIHAIFVILSS